MKYYKVGEISKLYNISSDILRHYEKMGLLLPEKKGKNSYRYYSNKQIWKLGTIRALRQLGVGLEEIKEYLGERNLENSTELIGFQLKVVNEKLKELSKTKVLLERKSKYLQEYQSERKDGIIIRKKIGERKCYKRYKSVVTDWEIDLELRRLKYEADSNEGEHFASSKVGAMVDIDGYNTGLYNLFEGTFLIDRDGEEVLKEGEYLSLTFTGGYNKADNYYKKLKEYIEKNNLKVDGEILELYKIDIYETDNEEEFVTEIQIPVKF